MSVESIKGKAKSYLSTKEGKIKINSAISKKIKENKAGTSPKSAGEAFVSVLRSEINMLAATSTEDLRGGGLGASAIETLNHIKVSSPFKVSDNIYTVEISFTGDLTRPSLAPKKYGGIDNVAALLNNGYDANRSVHGYWHGEDKWSLVSRQGAHFMNNAVDRFSSEYKDKFNIVNIELNDIYT